MKERAIQNFHVPLPKGLYERLRAEASRSRKPATRLARQAIETWLRQRKKAAVHEAIASFARERAGSRDDLDEALETASVEYLLTQDEGTR